MSRVAGVVLIIYGLACFYLTSLEFTSSRSLPNFATIVTAALGVVLCLAGAAHFKAPHKSFLISIPLVLFFLTQMHFNIFFYFDTPNWKLEIALAMCSAAVLLFSYGGSSPMRRREYV